MAELIIEDKDLASLKDQVAIITGERNLQYLPFVHSLQVGHLVLVWLRRTCY